MKHEARAQVVQMVPRGYQLEHGLIIGVFTVAKNASVPHQERHRHEHPVAPQLPLAALAVGMPETAVLGARIGIESLSNAVCSELVFGIFHFLVEEQQEIAGQ